MSLFGRGVVAIWHGLHDDGRKNFYEWHNTEHMPERAGIAGFVRGRRYHDHKNPAELFTLYETQGTDVLTSSEYLARLNAPTPWTVESIRAFTNLSRALSEVAFSRSTGDGTVLRVLKFDTAGADATSIRGRLIERLERIGLVSGVVGVHLCATKIDASAIKSVEKKDQTLVRPAAWTVLIEFGAEQQDIGADHPMVADVFGEEPAVIDLTVERLSPADAGARRRADEKQGLSRRSVPYCAARHLRRMKHNGCGVGSRPVGCVRDRAQMRCAVAGAQARRRAGRSRGSSVARPRCARVPCDARSEVAPRNSLHSLRSLRSNTRGESDHEARGYARRPQPCASRRRHSPRLRPARRLAGRVVLGEE